MTKRSKDMDRHLISHRATLLDALCKLNKLPGREMTLFVIDEADRVAGTLTDGDIRRGLTSGLQLGDEVSRACNTSFKALRGGDEDEVAMLRRCRDNGITLLPELDPEGHITGIINLNKTYTRLPLSAVLMAGGKGERLRPMTLTVPKPLLEIDGKAIIDYNIEALARCGIRDITVTTRYLADKIAAHFAVPVAGVDVRCVEESMPLGTVGALSLIDRKPEGDTLVMNSDLLTTLSFEDLYLRHKAEGADVTIAVIPYQISVPYAILTTDGNAVTGLQEKPSYSYYANAGIYIFSNRLLDTLEKNVRIDATDFIENAIASGCRVTYFPINGTWIDVGSPVDFKHAGELMRHHRAMSHADNNN